MSFGADIAEFVNQQLHHFGFNTEYIVSELIVSVLIFLFFIMVGWIVYRLFEHYLVGFAHKTKE